MEFDLHEIRSEILERYPEWIDLMNAAEFRNSSAAESAGHSGNRVLYNSFRLRQLDREAQKFLIAAAVYPLLRRPQSVGIRGSSHPDTYFSSTSCLSFLLLMTVWSMLRRANSICLGL